MNKKMLFLAALTVGLPQGSVMGIERGQEDYRERNEVKRFFRNSINMCKKIIEINDKALKIAEIYKNFKDFICENSEKKNTFLECIENKGLSIPHELEGSTCALLFYAAKILRNQPQGGTSISDYEINMPKILKILKDNHKSLFKRIETLFQAEPRKHSNDFSKNFIDNCKKKISDILENSDSDIQQICKNENSARNFANKSIAPIFKDSRFVKLLLDHTRLELMEKEKKSLKDFCEKNLDAFNTITEKYSNNIETSNLISENIKEARKNKILQIAQRADIVINAHSSIKLLDLLQKITDKSNGENDIQVKKKYLEIFIEGIMIDLSVTIGCVELLSRNELGYKEVERVIKCLNAMNEESIQRVLDPQDQRDPADEERKEYL